MRMMTMKKTLIVLTIAALSAGVGACSSSSMPLAPSATTERGGTEAAQPDFAAAAKPGTTTIAGIVLQADGEFDVLQAAVVRAGLGDTLNGTRQFTVFAPTDAAFVTTLGVVNEAAAIAAVNSLDLQVLENILLFHVSNGRRNSTSILAAPGYVMLNGQKLTREQLSAAGIATADVSASNGIVHVINHVLLP
jgi:uncharacterized surface protein with fasciclin (FAS1) repeats